MKSISLVLRLLVVIYCSQFVLSQECSETLSATIPEEGDYDGTFSNSMGTFSMFWKICLVDEEEVAEVTLSAETTGWVAFGLRHEEGDDVWIGYVNDAQEVVIQDRFGQPRMLPPLDSAITNGVDNAGEYSSVGVENAGITTIKFRRKVNTGDSVSDYLMENAQNELIWAYGPMMVDGLTPMQHTMTSHRGNAFVNFYDGVVLTPSGSLVDAHYYVMILTWYILAPCTIVLYYFSYAKARTFVYATSAGVIIGFLLIFFSKSGGAHFETPHTWLGGAIIIASLTVSTLIASEAASATAIQFSPYAPVNKYWLAYIGVAVVAWQNIILGFDLVFNMTTTPIIISIILVVTTLFVVVAPIPGKKVRSNDLPSSTSALSLENDDDKKESEEIPKLEFGDRSMMDLTNIGEGRDFDGK